MRLRGLLSACVLAGGLGACGTDVLTTEPGPGYLGPGDTAYVDNGKCPAGQVQRVVGPATLTSSRVYTCVKKPSGGLF